MTSPGEPVARSSVLASLGAKQFSVVEHGSVARSTKSTALLLSAVLGVMGAGLAMADDAPNRFQAQIDQIRHERSQRLDAVASVDSLANGVRDIASAPVRALQWATTKTIKAQLANGNLDADGVLGRVMEEADQIDREADRTSDQFVEPTPASVTFDAGMGLLTSAAFPPATVLMAYSAARDGYEIMIARDERKLEERLQQASARIDTVEAHLRDEALGRESQGRMGLEGRAFEIAQEIQVALAMKHLQATGDDSEVVVFQRQKATMGGAEPWLAEYDNQVDVYVRHDPVQAFEAAQQASAKPLGRSAFLSGLARLSDSKTADAVETPFNRGTPSYTMR